MPPTTNGSLPQGLHAGRMRLPTRLPHTKREHASAPPHGKDKKRTQKNKQHSLVRLQAPAYDHTASPPPEAAPAGCRPGRRRMSALAGCGSAGYNGGGQCSRTQAVVCKLYTGKDYRADSHVSVAA